MDFNSLLRKAAERAGHIACVGLDPVIERIPLDGSPGAVIVDFYSAIREAFEAEGVIPSAVKPNIAYYEQYGLEGLEALEKVISLFRKIGVPVILDAKRGDIGRSSEAYANAVFDEWSADAVTVSPYMGHDSVKPFLREGRGVYVLCRTSNRGAEDFQDLDTGDGHLYRRVAGKIKEWRAGAVVGATSMDEFREIAGEVSGAKVPLLIPGVGAQGGSASDVMKALRDASYDTGICRINSSSGINYAYEQEETDFAVAAAKALKKLAGETRI